MPLLAVCFMLLSSLSYIWALEMEAIYSPETSVDFQPTMKTYSVEDRTCPPSPYCGKAEIYTGNVTSANILARTPLCYYYHHHVSVQVRTLGFGRPLIDTSALHHSQARSPAANPARLTRSLEQGWVASPTIVSAIPRERSNIVQTPRELR